MPNIPAVCEACGAFFPSGFVVDNSSDITFRNVTAGPCPRCGGTGHIPDGAYNFFGNTIELLRGPERTVSELRRLAVILRDAQQRGASAEEIETAVQRDVPGLKPVIDLLPRNRGELYDFISMLAAIVSIIIALKAMTLSSNQAPQFNVQNITVEQVIKRVYQSDAQPDARDNTKTTAPTIKNHKHSKIGRNEPCPCGSGKKYKRCHLESDANIQHPIPNQGR